MFKKRKKEKLSNTQLMTKLKNLRKEKKERETRKKNIREIKQLEREKKPLYRIAKKIGTNLKDKIEKEKEYQRRQTKKPTRKKEDSYLEKLNKFAKW